MAPSDALVRLTGFGLAIASDRAIRGTLADTGDGIRAADIVIVTLAPISAEMPPPPVYRWDGETLIFYARGVARYRCRRDGITIAAEHGADPDMVSDLLIATALPAVLWLRGDPMLHAAAIVAPGKTAAFAIAGPSGIGKSTVVSQLLDAGGTLVADDTIRVTRRDDRIIASGLAGGYHLASQDGTARAFHHVTHLAATDNVPIRGIAFLSRTAGPPAVQRLDPISGLERLLANQHRPAVPAMIGRVAQSFALLSDVAQRCEMYEWHRSSPLIDAAERAMLSRAGLAEWVTS